jgi:sugar phosphate isomerase/epimerase
MFKNLNLGALGISGRQSEVIELTLSHGFKGVDLELAEFGHQVEGTGLAHSRRLLDSARLKIGSVRLALQWDCDTPAFDAQLEKLSTDIQMVKTMGCTRAITDIDPASDTRPYHENFELHRRRYGKLAETLGRHGLKLGLGFLAPTALREAHQNSFIQTVEPFLMLVKSISSPNVGVALDVWHWHLGGGTIDQIRALAAGKIVTVALADADPDTTAANADRAIRRLPGATGVIDSAQVVSILAAGKYDGPVTAMPSPAAFAGEGREQIVKQTAQSLDALWKAAGLQTARPGMVSRV